MSLLHLLVNMVPFLYLGRSIEPKIGWLRFSLIFLISGWISSLLTFWLNDFTLTLGSTSAIFGLAGVWVAGLRKRKVQDRNEIPIWVSLVTLFVLSFYFEDIQINLPGRIVAFLFGFSITRFHYLQQRREQTNVGMIITNSLLAFVLLSASVMIIHDKYVPRSAYAGTQFMDLQMQLFKGNESYALSVLKLSKSNSKEYLLEKINEAGINYWIENLRLIDELEGVQLSKKDERKLKALRKYCHLRIEQYRLIYKNIDEETDKYDNRINEIEFKISEIKTGKM